MLPHLRLRATSQLLAFAGFVAVALLVLALHLYHFRDINYRDDELRTIHAGQVMSPREVIQWMSIDIHPPLWRVSATSWVAAFGVSEPVTRWLSSLYSVLALAMIFRLGRDLFDAQTGIFAALILGTHALFMFYGHEFRPYPLLTFWIAGMHLTFWRWLRRPAFRSGLLYVIFGAGALYTHFFTVYVIAAQMLAFVLLVRWRPHLYLQVVGLWLAIGLAFGGWLPSFLHSFLVTKPGGIDYGIDAELVNTRLIYTIVQMQPYSLGNLLLPAALLIPLRRILPKRAYQEYPLRFGSFGVTWYFAIIVGFIVVAAFLTDRVIGVLTDRNLLATTSALAVIAAVGIRAFPWQMRLVAVALLLHSGLTNFQRYERAEPFQQELAFMEPAIQAGDPVIISVDNGFGVYFAHAYYLLGKLPEQVTRDKLFYLTAGSPRVNLPEDLPNAVTDASAESLAQFRALVDDAERVWWITSSAQVDYAEVYIDVLEEDYTLVRSESFDDLERYERVYSIKEYNGSAD